MALVRVEGVHHSFGDGPSARTVLKDVDLTLTESRVGVIGANGSGKSTFVRLLNGLVHPERGTVTIDGLDTVRDGRKVRTRVGFCFTDPDAQIVMPTVAEDIAFGLRGRSVTAAEREQRTREALAAYGLSDHADHPAHLLSGGQKQLLALASVLVTEPDVLVLDEPTTLLDLRNAAMIRRVIDDLPQQVIVVTHHLDLLTGFERVLVFDQGEVIADADPDRARAAYRRHVLS